MRRVRRLPGLIVISIAVAACSGRPSAAPPTDVERRPEVIGVITKWEPDSGSHLWRYRLDTGEAVELNINDHGQGEVRIGDTTLPEMALLSEDDIHFNTTVGVGIEPGDEIEGPTYLVFVGHDPDGSRWYAAARESGGTCPFVIRGGGVYDEGAFLHFSTGLVLAKHSEFAVTPDYLDHPFPLRAPDTICVDGTGAALSANIWLAY